MLDNFPPPPMSRYIHSPPPSFFPSAAPSKDLDIESFQHFEHICEVCEELHAQQKRGSKQKRRIDDGGGVKFLLYVGGPKKVLTGFD